MPERETTVVVLNWNGLEHTRACLGSLAAVRDEWRETIVVDNGSSDGSPTALRSEFPWARVVEARANLGYTGGNNLGIREALAAGAGSVLLLNNDATVAAGAIALLREAALRDARVGIAGPLAVEQLPDGREYFLFGGTLTRRPFRVRERWRRTPPDSPEPFEVDYVSGRALYVRREVLERIGLLDDRFFLTWEDTDWGERIRGAGLRSVVVPEARIRHLGSASFDGYFSPLYAYYFFRNMALFATLHLSRRARPRCYRDAAALARSMLRRHASGRRARVAGAIVLGFAHFAVGRFGPAPEFLTRNALRARAFRAAVAPASAGHQT